MNIKGKIKVIGETQTFESGFSKRQLVLTTLEQYPQDLAVEFVKDKTSVLDSCDVGDSVEVAINLRGNEYNGKYYVNLQGWKINKEGKEQQVAAGAPMKEGDLPF